MRRRPAGPARIVYLPLNLKATKHVASRTAACHGYKIARGNPHTHVQPLCSAESLHQRGWNTTQWKYLIDRAEQDRFARHAEDNAGRLILGDGKGTRLFH